MSDIKGGWGDSHLGTNGDMINTHLESGKWTYGGAIPFCCGKNYISDFDIVIDLSGNSTTCDSDDSGKCCEPLTFASTNNVCDDEWLVTWFNYQTTNTALPVLNDSSILKVKNVDDCTKLITLNKKNGRNYTNYPYRFSSAQTFELSTYIDCGDPTLITCVTDTSLECVEKYSTGSTNPGHKIKYKPISNTIPTNFIVNNTGLTEIYFPSQYGNDSEFENTDIIGLGACSGNTNLTAITLGKTTAIEKEAFKGCSGLTIIDWGRCGWDEENKEKIEGKDCILRSHRDSSLRTIGESAFSGCTSLKYINLPNSLTTIGASAFTDVSTASGNGILHIPYGVTTIEQDAFKNANFDLVCWSVVEMANYSHISPFTCNCSDLYLPNLNATNACQIYNEISTIISTFSNIYVKDEYTKEALASCAIGKTVDVWTEDTSWPYIDVQGACY